jgi:ATP-dependent Lon protease
MDRLDIVNVEGYSLREKIEIAKKHLIPRALADCGLTGRIEIGFQSDAVIEFLIARHTAAEAGVRNLARRLADIFRFIALEISSSSSFSKHPPLTKDDISRILGPALEQGPSIPTALPVGVSLGLAVSQTGGEVLFVECVTTGLGTGSVTVTGQLGDVMKESVSTALSLVRSSTLIMVKRIEKNFDIHVHFPTASVHKDGPSAGLSTFIAIASLFSNVSARSDMASSGEITLRGEVLPIGGVKQKVAAAHRAGLKTVLLPWGNKGSLRPGDLSAEVERDVKLIFVRNVQEVLRAAFPATANVTTTPHYESAL